MSPSPGIDTRHWNSLSQFSDHRWGGANIAPSSSRHTDCFKQSRHTATWVGAQWGAVAGMFRVQEPRSFHRVLVAILKLTERSLGKHLGASEEFCRASLRRGPVEKRRLVFEVKNEPQLDARIGDCQFDPVSMGEIDCLRNVRMFVDIEDAPDPVMRTTSTPLRVPRLLPLSFNRMLYELQRASVKLGNMDEDVVAMLLCPVDEITLFGAFPFDEHENLGPNRDAADSALRSSSRLPLGQSRAPVVISSAAASNSWRDNTGVAP